MSSPRPALMKKIILLLCVLSCFLTSVQTHGQLAKDHYFEHLDMSDGLSGSTVFSILQDSQGFMWFGTKNGLNRYDGHSFRHFGAQPDKPNTLKDNFIYGLFEDSQQRIWVGTGDGLFIYNSKTEDFISFDLQSDLGNQVRGSIGEVKEDQSGNIWIAANRRGFFKYNEKDNTLIQHQPFSENQEGFTPPDNTSSIVIDPKGDIWVATTSRGLFKFSIHEKGFKPVKMNQEVIDAFILELEDFGNYLLIGTKNMGVVKMDKSTGQCIPLLTKDPYGKNLFIREICKTSPQELWIGTESGIFNYNLETNTYQNLRENPNDPYSISDNAIYSIYQDNEEGMWVGTYFGGLNYLPNHPTSFKKHYPISTSNSISGKRVREFEAGKNGTIWIGTEDAGLNLYDPKTDLFRHFKPENNLHSLSYHNVHGLARKGDQLWVGTATFAEGLNLVDLSTNKIKPISLHSEEHIPHDNEIHSLIVDHKDRLWMGTVGGLFRYHDSLQRYNWVPEVGHKFIYDLLEDKHNNLWLATYGAGLIRYNPETKETKLYTSDSAIPESLPHDLVISLFEDSQGRIWIATEGGGFCLYEPSTDSFTPYNTSNGFPCTNAYKVVEDISGHLWISSDKGLLEFNPQTTQYRLFTSDNGLMPYPFNYKSGFRDKDGTLYFGCLNGFISFDPRDFKPYTYNPPIVFTGIQVFNKPVEINSKNPILKQAITHSSQITLNYSQSSLSFDFAALSYTASKARPYAYKMEGFDQDWTYLSQNQRINYTYLPPGQYTLKVKSANIFGEWSDSIGSLDLLITPPFWKTSWAYLCYFLLLGTILFWLSRSYNNRIAHRQKLAFKRLEDETQKEVYQSKIEFFTNITHEIRTPLTLIKGPLESILRKNESLPTEIRENLWIMNKNANRLIDLSNELLDFRKTEKQDFRLNFTRTDVGKLLNDTYTRFKTSAEQKLINCHLTGIQTPYYADIDREAFTKIISNLLSNAIKNAEATVTIQLIVMPQEEDFKVLISNDGKLISAELKHKIFEPFFQIDGNTESGSSPGTGLGLPLARSLAEMHGGKLFLDQALEANRNTFTLQLPIKQQSSIILSDPMDQTEEQDSHAKPPKEKVEMRSNHKKPSLLVVEDHRELQQFIYKELKAEYLIHKAENGKQALAILNEKPVDLIISDVMMPIMDGFALCNAVKSNLEFSHIPLILLTAKNTLSAKIEGMEMGADVYLEKPFSMEYLSLQAKNLLQYRDKIRQAFANQPLVHVESIAHTRADEEFLFKANEAILDQLSNEAFGVNELADVLCMSQSSLLRKIKGVSELTPNGYIRLVRLKKAAELLRIGNYSITEISEKVGFNSPSYFSKCFHKQFGELPKDFSKKADFN